MKNGLGNTEEAIMEGGTVRVKWDGGVMMEGGSSKEGKEDRGKEMRKE